MGQENSLQVTESLSLNESVIALMEMETISMFSD